MKYVCSICGYVYDEAVSGPWADLPEGWKCPLCGAAKSDFAPEGAARPRTDVTAAPVGDAEMKELSSLETAALCSNLARGCEKQYQAEQAAAFRKLADWFTARQGAAADPSFERLLALVENDLNAGYPAADEVSRQKGDRGALRSLVWSEKVTRILRSLLTRYAQEGDAMLENTGVYVCTICGFVYVGDELPEVCPVCKVPNRKFERIGGGAA
ncbi:MAG: rubredoxin [Oscillospiraceae bacterium]|nr:rubredoxin [Oscillospiraceae bacterium]